MRKPSKITDQVKWGWRWNIKWKIQTASGEPWHVWGIGLNLDNFRGFHIMLGKAVVSFGWVLNPKYRALRAERKERHK